MVREVCYECEIGIRVGRKIINMIRYVDDKAVVASSQKGLQQLMNRLKCIVKNLDLYSATSPKPLMLWIH